MTIKKQKTIWLINQYASTLESGIGGRHYYLASELAKMGYIVYLISSSFHHLLKKPYPQEQPILIQNINGFNFVTLKVPEYPNAHSKQRIFNEFRFSSSIKNLSKNKLLSQPDIILYSSPSLIPYTSALNLSKKFKSKLFFEVRDIWPLTLMEIGGYPANHPFIMLLSYIEKKAYKTADMFISNLPFAIDHMQEFGVKKEDFVWLPNGFCLSDFETPDDLSHNVSSLLPKNKFLIMYTGTLGLANSIDTLLQAAEKLKSIPEIAIVLVGDGKEKANFVDYAKQKNLTNVYFLPSIPKKQIPSMLSKADICYVGMLNSRLYRFGTALTKLPEYMASGKPIVYGSSSKFQPIQDAKAGITIPAQDSDAIVDAVKKIYSLSHEERQAMGQAGREYAIKHFEYRQLAQKFTNLFN